MSEAHTGSAKPFGRLERTIAWRYLRARREHGGASFISIISFIGIFLAVTALIVSMSVMSGFRATLLDALLGGQPHITSVVDNFSEDETTQIRALIEGVDGVSSASPFIEQTVLVTSNGASTGAAVRALVLDDMDTLPFLQEGGRKALEAGFGEGRNGGDVIMMGAALAGKLRIREGDRAKIITPQINATAFGSAPRSKEYTVGHIFNTGSYELDELYIFMPMEQAQVLFNYKDRYQYLDIRVDDPEDVTEIQEAIGIATGNGVYSFTWKQQREQYFNALEVERMMVRLLVMILMLIASLNIIVGVVMLVKNKTSDIAILRTIGLGRGSVMRIFFLVGTTLGVMGATLGLLLGVVIVLNIGVVEAFLNLFAPGGKIFDESTYGLDGLPAVLDWWEVLSTAIWATITSMLVSIIPAWWAARQDPVKALRFG